MQPSPDNIKMARFVAGAIGFEPNVYPYYDNDRTHELSILNLIDPIDPNVCIYMTIGVSDHENLVAVKDGHENIPIELFFATYKQFDKARNILATVGFYIVKDKYECRPGNVFKNMINMYYTETDMKHIFFTSPYLWQDKLEGLELDYKKVHFLLMIPCSDAEVDYKLKHGDDALETLFEDNDIDIFDLNRKSLL
jgi:antitoxin YqcF